jgi:hypothetical protein
MKQYFYYIFAEPASDEDVGQTYNLHRFRCFRMVKIFIFNV